MPALSEAPPISRGRPVAAIGQRHPFAGAVLDLRAEQIGLRPGDRADVASYTLIFEGVPHLWPIGTASIVGIAYIGVFGVGLAHFLFWSIVGRLSTATAAIGVLLVPVVGIAAATIILGERPTPTDIVGFTLIFLAAATVLLKPAIKTPVAPE